MNRCGICKESKSAHSEPTDHAYQQDTSLPTWKGWHTFRRGHATELARTFSKGDGLEVAAMALRHSDSGVTDQYHVKVTGQVRRAQLEGPSWPPKANATRPPES